MKIYCKHCNKLMGNINKGSKTRKGIVYLCDQCYDRLKLAELAFNNQNKDTYKPNDLFNNIFGTNKNYF